MRSLWLMVATFVSRFPAGPILIKHELDKALAVPWIKRIHVREGFSKISKISDTSSHRAHPLTPTTHSALKASSYFQRRSKTPTASDKEKRRQATQEDTRTSEAHKSQSTMREIIHVQVGQCGNQIGSKVGSPHPPCLLAFHDSSTPSLILPGCFSSGR